MGLEILRGEERVVKSDLPRIFTDVCEEEYNLLAPLSAKVLVEATKRQQTFLNPKEFEKKEDENALYIRLNGSKGGLRATSSNQWNQLANALWESKKDNVFLIVDGSVFGSSEFENKVLTDYLSSLDKNVYVISEGARNTYKKIGDVHYFTLGSGNELLSLTRLDNHKYLAFDFGKTVTFGWKSLY